MSEKPEKVANLHVGWGACERGNCYFTRIDNHALYTRLPDDNMWLVTTILPGNYPAASVRVHVFTDAELAAHINKHLGGWHVQKCNVDGVDIGDDGCVVDQEVPPTESFGVQTFGDADN